jgi:hypothetical protein
MAKRCSKRRGARVHRRTRKGGMGHIFEGGGGGGGRKKMMRTRRRTRRGGFDVKNRGPWGGHMGEGGGGRKKMMRTRRRTRRGGQSMQARGMMGGMSDGKQDAQVIGIRSSL